MPTDGGSGVEVSSEEGIIIGKFEAKVRSLVESNANSKRPSLRSIPWWSSLGRFEVERRVFGFDGSGERELDGGGEGGGGKREIEEGVGHDGCQYVHLVDFPVLEFSRQLL
jgi:hypothetical protein